MKIRSHRLLTLVDALTREMNIHFCRDEMNAVSDFHMLAIVFLTVSIEVSCSWNMLVGFIWCLRWSKSHHYTNYYMKCIVSKYISTECERIERTS